MAVVLPVEDALHTIARNNASGALQLSDESRAIFVNGDFSHMEQENTKQIAGICSLLNDAGCLADQVLSLVRKANVAVDRLGTLLVSREYLAQEEFDRARYAYAKNCFLELCYEEAAPADFTPDRTVRTNELSLSINAAELLLDVVGMRTSRLELFGSDGESGSSFCLSEDYEVQGLTLEEVMVVRALQSHSEGLSGVELERHTLLAKSELYIALRELQEKNVVVGSHADTADSEVRAELDEDEEEEILADLFDETLEEVAQGQVSDEDEQIDPMMQLYDDDSEPGFAGSYSIEETRNGEPTLPAEFEPESNRWADNEAERGEINAFNLGLRLRMLNYRLTETSVVVHVVLGITALYLVFLAHILPSELRGIFDALSQFTNVQ